MTNWFDLPQEVKQTIFSYVCDADAIVYVPRDRRKKVDRKYLDHKHFHDILLVSKQFITPDDFAFAILGTAKPTFDCYNDLKRLITEVSPAFKQCVRRIHLRRSLSAVSTKVCHDSFDGFCRIGEKLASSFPELKQIFVSLPEYCANIGHYGSPYCRVVPSDVDINGMMLFTLVSQSDNTEERQETINTLEKHRDYTPRYRALRHAVASFIGNRATREGSFAWTRPQPWLVRLVRFAEASDIEIIIQLNLCLTNTIIGRDNSDSVFPHPTMPACWANREYHFWCAYSKTIHTPATMSTKDWMLRVMWDGCEYSYYQGLAFEMIHAPQHKSLSFWFDMLKDLSYNSLGQQWPTIPTYSF